MKILVMTMSCLISLTLLPCNAVGQDVSDSDSSDQQDNDELDDLLDDELELLADQDVVVSAAKHKQKLGFSPSAVIVITRKEIEESGATTLLDLFRRYPAIHVFEFDPLYPTLHVRGSYRALLMIDGREVNIDILVPPFYSLIPVGLNDIERIEVVLGPNSSLYGANAVAVVFNIVTRKPTSDFKTDLSISAGQHGTTSFSGLFEGGYGPWALQVTGGIERANSWMTNDQLSKDLKRINITTVLPFNDGELILNGGVVEGTGRLWGILGYLDFENFFLPHAKVEFNYGKLKTRAYWYGLRSVFDLELDLVHPALNDSLGSMPTFHMAGDTAHIECQYDLNLFENNFMIIGSDFRYTIYRSQQFVDPEIEEYRVGVFAHDEHRFSERIVLTLGARFDWNNKTSWAISPKAALVYNPADEHYLRISGGTAFRKPTLSETSANFIVDENPAFPEIEELFEEQGLSNSNLENELLISGEIGYRAWLLERALRLSTDLYFALDRDRIAFVNDVRYDQFGRIDLVNSNLGYENLGRDSNIVGLNIKIEGEPLDMLTLFIRGEFRYHWFDSDGQREEATSPITAAAGATLRLPSGLTAHVVYIYVHGRYDSLRDPQSVLAPELTTDLSSESFLMANLNYRIELGSSKLDLGLNFFNPFGGRFREIHGVFTSDLANYGGELLGTRFLATARFQY
jgi:outer membrane receptor protein involved in Fe transport